MRRERSDERRFKCVLQGDILSFLHWSVFGAKPVIIARRRKITLAAIKRNQSAQTITIQPVPAIFQLFAAPNNAITVLVPPHSSHYVSWISFGACVVRR